MLPVIPKPNKIVVKDGRFIIDYETVIEAEMMKDVLYEYVYEETGYKLQDARGNKLIRVSLCQEMKFLKEEGYQIHIDQGEIEIEAYQENGLFYGIQTLRQLLHAYKNEIPCIEIEDSPRFSHRGFMLDVGRHFFDKNEVKKLIDLCVLQKLNVFHFHLTEDQGWRLEIEKYPLLTKVGSYREETVIKSKSDGTPVRGYYTKADILEIVAYARERYIKVIPEIDIPGHLQAAIAAYPHLSCLGEEVDVWNRFGISKVVACAGKESTYSFLADVLDEVCAMFDTDRIHLGGDEAPKDRWKKCPHCQAKMRDEGLRNEEELQAYFINRISRYLRGKGIKAITWNDSLKASILDKDILIQHWMDGKKKKNVVAAINEGRQVIISDYYNHYLDYPYGMTPLTKTYHFNPIFDGVKPEKESCIIGLEAPLWTEYVKDTKRLYYMTFPRLTAVADRAWNSGALDYRDFTERLKCFYKLLDRYDIPYAKLNEVDVRGIKGMYQTARFFLESVRVREIVGMILSR